MKECGKKYNVLYVSGGTFETMIDSVHRRNIKEINGVLENVDTNIYSSKTRFYFRNNNDALEIVPLASIIEMREITE